MRLTACSISGSRKGSSSRARRGSIKPAAASRSPSPLRIKTRARKSGTLSSRLRRSTAISPSELGNIHRRCIFEILRPYGIASITLLTIRQNCCTRAYLTWKIAASPRRQSHSRSTSRPGVRPPAQRAWFRGDVFIDGCQNGTANARCIHRNFTVRSAGVTIRSAPRQALVLCPALRV